MELDVGVRLDGLKVWFWLCRRARDGGDAGEGQSDCLEEEETHGEVGRGGKVSGMKRTASCHLRGCI